MKQRPVISMGRSDDRIEGLEVAKGRKALDDSTTSAICHCIEILSVELLEIEISKFKERNGLEISL